MPRGDQWSDHAKLVDEWLFHRIKFVIGLDGAFFGLVFSALILGASDTHGRAFVLLRRNNQPDGIARFQRDVQPIVQLLPGEGLRLPGRDVLD